MPPLKFDPEATVEEIAGIGRHAAFDAVILSTGTFTRSDRRFDELLRSGIRRFARGMHAVNCWS